ncbi:L-dopachrome tautomerase-related protein [Cognatishimia maritima]|uniref:Major royal jelly protein n=1 Tax=Cognatishimia maritima TaxID=870908 RepID=A0A1M5VZA8_9RHOB|nr:L-dopachrome tautomerase-related protein [Cognatishimia maritima]SHH80659.1 Major royal jelly protein [Cognatishimia maritima]
MLKQTIAACLLVASGTQLFAGELETYVELGREIPPGNIAVGPEGRVFISVHEFYGLDLRMAEVFADGSTRPYPDEDWARAPNGKGLGLNGVLGLQVDRSGILWMLDGQREDHVGRVVGWDTKSETLHAVYSLGQPATRPTSFLNDLAVDKDHGAIYIADTGDGQNSAIVVLDTKTGQARRVLEGSRFTLPEDLPMMVDGKELIFGGQPARVGINPITVDPTNTWVYFGPMTSESLYRVRTRDLLDPSLSDSDLEARVERYGDKAISDGISVDAAGNVYITAITDNAIGVTKADGTYEVLHQSDERLSWPDGFAVGHDGYVYATVNQLQRSPVLNNGVDKSSGAYSIVRFQSLEEAISGR